MGRKVSDACCYCGKEITVNQSYSVTTAQFGKGEYFHTWCRPGSSAAQLHLPIPHR